MDCLILGGYGFLGSRIVDYLKKKEILQLEARKKKLIILALNQ